MPETASDSQKIAPICFTSVAHRKSRPPAPPALSGPEDRVSLTLGGDLSPWVSLGLLSHECVCEMKRRREMGRAVRLCSEGGKRREKEKEK